MCFGVQVRRTPWPLHISVPHPWYFISCHIGDNVSFKFGGVEKKHIVFILFVFVVVRIKF
jgi:hypothetical protein